ncbi:hypothetical protein RHOER0001_4077 [Rhodococcus erythropolis SK121]|nr:hypothetical protein RHOER0001_4077 [Rhodococcus erythropolis SK121]
MIHGRCPQGEPHIFGSGQLRRLESCGLSRLVHTVSLCIRFKVSRS